MATATTPRNRKKIWHAIRKRLANVEAGGFLGRNQTMGSLIRHVWVSAGAPSSTAPTGMVASDFIYDSTNNAVYVYEDGTTYTRIDG